MRTIVWMLLASNVAVFGYASLYYMFYQSEASTHLSKAAYFSLASAIGLSVFVRDATFL